ncbi:MAG TPA: glutamine amidotransferase [Vicinamibacterales bacterium]
MSQVGFANPLPWWALVAMLAAAAALSWHAYRGFSAWPKRRYVLSALRFATLLLLLVVLMRPVSRTTTGDSRDVVVPILVDTSRSMAIEDAEGGRRIDRAREYVTDVLVPRLRDHFQIEVLSFGETLEVAEPATLTAAARRSDLAGALAAARERYRGRPVAGILLLSDGGDTSGVMELTAAESLLPPVHAVGFGSADVGQDREVLSVTAADAVLDAARVDLAVSAVAHGSHDPVELRLLENGRPRDVRHVRPPADGGPIHEVFQVSPAAGAATIYTVEIPPLPGELVPENNRRSVLVQPPSRPRRILLVEGAPGYEHSFLKRALMGDRSLEVDAVVRKGQNEQGNDTYYIQASRSRSGALASGFPPDPASLFVYDAIVLANAGGDQFTGVQLESVRDFVSRRGGGLLVFGAQSFLGRGLAGTPVEDALPVLLDRRADAALPAGSASGGNKLSLTSAGLDHPVTRLGGTPDESRKRWESLPALASASAIGTPRPGAEILATAAAGGAARPLVAVQRYGEGRSMVFAGEASWRWRMMLPSSDTSYETFWRQAVRWIALGASDPVAIHPVAAAGVGDEVAIRASVRDRAFRPVRDADVQMRIVSPDGKLNDIRAAFDSNEGPDGSLFTGTFTPEGPGLHRVTVTARRGKEDVGEASTSVLIGGADTEMADPRLNLHLLERIAAGTGGRVTTPGDAGNLVATLQAATPAAALAVSRDLWHNGASLILIIGLLTSEWLLRRKWGLR